MVCWWDKGDGQIQQDHARGAEVVGLPDGKGLRVATLTVLFGTGRKRKGWVLDRFVA